MHHIRVYVDTSVFGGTEDDEFRDESHRFFRAVERGEYIVLVSDVTYAELLPAPESVRAVFDNIDDEKKEFIPLEQEAEELARIYIDGEVLGEASLEDALHVAMATVAGADLILSWNFQHIVNYRRIRMFNALNIMHGYKPLDIRSPLEVGGEEKEL